MSATSDLHHHKLNEAEAENDARLEENELEVIRGFTRDGTTVGESGNELTHSQPGQGPQKYSETFFSPKVAHLRGIYFKIVGIYTLLTIIAIWTCLTFYWGSLWQQTESAHQLDIIVLDRNLPRSSSELTFSILGAITAAQAQPIRLGWEILDNPNERYPTDADLERGLVDHDAWGAVVIHAGATEALRRARENGDASYDPTSAVSYFYVQARNEIAAGNFLVPFFNRTVGSALSQLNSQSAAGYLTEQGRNATAMALLAQAPQTIAGGYGYQLRNLRPYNATVATAVTLVGLIYLLVLSFVQTMAHDAARSIIGPFLTTRSYLTIRIVTPICNYFVLSFFFCMIDLPFKVPFGQGPFSYAGGFFLWWIFLWAGMCSLGLATEAAITVLTPKFISFFLIALIVVNVSETAVPIELSGNAIYRIGHGLMFYNLSEAVRCIIFNTKNKLGQNFAVLVAWIAVSLVTIPLLTVMMRRKEIKAAEAASRPKEEEKRI